MIYSKLLSFFPKEVEIRKAEKQMNSHPKYIHNIDALFLVFLKRICEPAMPIGAVFWPPEHNHRIREAKSR